MGRDAPRGSCGEKGLNCQILILGYLQFVERKHLHAVACSTGYTASVVARKLHRQLSMSGVSTRLKNGSLKQSRSSQQDGSDV
jgi:diaminopimelate epimerase